jgi:GTP cyclohydrolase I
MEIIATITQSMGNIMKQRHITWLNIKDKIKSLNLDSKLKYYGVPRGGQAIASYLNPVDSPEEADIIIDDLIDSGATKDAYTGKYNIPFIGLYDKQKEGITEWLKFPWEEDGDRDIEEHMARVIQYFDNGNREGLQDTPKRYIKFLTQFLTPDEFNFTTFDGEGTDEMIVQTNIPFYSLCEHHLAPFFGVAHIAYIPNGRIVGLSKLARTVELYTRRFQNQERITTQIAERLNEELNPLGVGVILKAQHLCMAMRGVKKHDVHTTTSKMIGAFKEDMNTRHEFLNLIKT